MGSVFVSVLNALAAIFASGLIQSLIKAIEDIYKASSGAEKKEVAMKMLTPVVPGLGVSIVSAAIDAQVSEFNEAGVFEHSARASGADLVNLGPSPLVEELARKGLGKG